jgi:hypothetical protein
MPLFRLKQCHHLAGWLLLIVLPQRIGVPVLHKPHSPVGNRSGGMVRLSLHPSSSLFLCLPLQGSRLWPFNHILRPFDLAVWVKCITSHTGAICTFYLVTSIKTYLDFVQIKPWICQTVKCIILMTPIIKVLSLPLCPAAGMSKPLTLSLPPCALPKMPASPSHGCLLPAHQTPTPVTQAGSTVLPKRVEMKRPTNCFSIRNPRSSL